MGEDVVNVRIIRNKMTGWELAVFTMHFNFFVNFNRVLFIRGAMGYCFVEMPDEATAERCLRKINGKSLPGASPVQSLIFTLYTITFFISSVMET